MKSSALLTACLLGMLALAACSTSKQDEPEAMPGERPMPEATPAPGTAKASARVVGYAMQEDHYVATLRIEEVEAYGAGTPVLPVGTEVAVVVSKALFDGDASKAEMMLATDHVVAITLSRVQRADTGEDPPPPQWRAVSIR